MKGGGNMITETLLQEEIQTEFESLKEMDLGTEDYRSTVDSLTKLVDRQIELKKIEVDDSFKKKQLDEDKKDRFVRNGIAIAGIVIPSVITIWGTLKSLKFEEEGTVTTIMGRGFINKLLPRK